jgi:bifunctional NMN adenylyltransferase/nudix hydrolase
MHDLVTYIGRFQPPHLAHIELMKMGLAAGKELLVLIGSAFQPRTIKNPWTWQERAQMIRRSLPDDSHVTCLPLSDIMYNDQKWAQQVQSIVNKHIETIPGANVALLGHSKDETSYYLKMFPQWDAIDAPNIEDIHASDVRAAYYMMQPDDFDIKVGRNLPVPIHNYLKSFTMKDEYDYLVSEYKFMLNYWAMWEGAPHIVQFITTDAVVIQSGHILLVRRRSAPGRGLWALPGGFLEPNLRVVDNIIKELREETKLKVPEPVLRGSIKCLDFYDHPQRSLRGRTLTHAGLIELAAGPLPKVKGADDADKAKWVPLGVFQDMEDQLFEDHYHIVNDMIDKL